jgi:hypothetical protein
VVLFIALIHILLCVQTIALIAVREGVVQLGSMKKVQRYSFLYYLVRGCGSNTTATLRGSQAVHACCTSE